MKKLFVLLVTFLLSLTFNVFVSYAQSFNVDFSQASGFGISSDEFQINQISIDLRVTNPITGQETIVNSIFNAIWKWDQEHLVLRPISAVDVTNANSTNICRGSLTVHVTDGLTGANIPNAVVIIGSRSEETNNDGEVVFDNLNEGNVLITVSAENYISQSLQTSINCSDSNQIGVSLLPLNNPGTLNGDIRIILTWGENPRDLDSHLTGPEKNSSERFHIYYANKNNCDSSMCDPSIPAWLDVDDVDSYGPETITITKIDGSFIPGTYKYSVHHYSGEGNIATSGAVVKVYVGDRLYRTFYPPQAVPGLGEGWVWTVFSLDIDSNGDISITPINTYTGPASSDDITFFSTITNYLGVPVFPEDKKLFTNLPPKK